MNISGWLQDIVVLGFSPDCCNLTLGKLNLRRLPPGMVAIDPNGETWTWQDHIQHQIQIVKFGEVHKNSFDGDRWGTIGIFDKTNLKHIQAMLQIAVKLGQSYSISIIED